MALPLVSWIFIRVRQLEFLIEGDTLIPPFIALEGLGENVAKQVVAAREEGESFPRQNCVNEEAYHQPWLKNWMKWES